MSLMENLVVKKLFLEFTLSGSKMNWKEIFQSSLDTLMPTFINLMVQVVLSQKVADPTEVIYLMSFL